MCGRYSLADLSGFAARFDLVRANGRLRRRYNIAPMQPIPAVVNDGANRLVFLRWGLVPSWFKGSLSDINIINARAETVHSKPSFRKSLQRRRCLIPADGFYEWKKDDPGSVKRPYRVTLKEGGLFAFAGLWDSWRSPGGENIISCAIITTAANEVVKPIHDRMPVILEEEAEQIWLDGEVTDSAALKRLLKPYPAELMAAYEVSTVVNSPANDIPGCIEPLRKA